MTSKTDSQKRMLKTIKRDRATEVFESLKQKILNFHLLPGVKISDKEVAQEMGLSRTPVREALSRLAEQGLVESHWNRGFTVKVFSRKEVEGHYRLRDSLESLAITLTSQHLDRKKVKVLRELVESYLALMKSHDLARFNDADEQFHELIALYSGNSALYEALRNLQGKIRIIRRYDHIRSTSFRETYDEHKQILDHMVKGEVAKARRAMSDHILTSMKTVMKTLPH